MSVEEEREEVMEVCVCGDELDMDGRDNILLMIIPEIDTELRASVTDRHLV